MGYICFDCNGTVVGVTVPDEVVELFSQYRKKSQKTIKELSLEIVAEFGVVSEETVINFIYSRVLPS